VSESEYSPSPSASEVYMSNKKQFGNNKEMETSQDGKLAELTEQFDIE